MFRGPLTGILVNASAVKRLRGYGVPLDETTSYRRCFEPKNTPRSSLRGANGSAQARPMTGSATKQSRAVNQLWIASLRSQ